jgi:hypothetical protein
LLNDLGHHLSDAFQLILPLELLGDSLLSGCAEGFPPGRVANQASQLLREVLDITTTGEQSILFMSDQFTRSSSTVSNIWSCVGPGLQEYQAKRIGTRGQSEQVDRREEIFFLLGGQRSQIRNSSRRPLPDPTELRHGRPGQDQATGDSPLMQPFDSLE